MSLAHNGHRRGNALLVTTLVVVTAVALLGVAANNVVGQRRVTKVDLDHQRALAAAETVAAMVEAKLVQRSGDPANLKRDLQMDPSMWWNLKGCSYTVNSGTLDAPVLTY